MKKVLTTKEGIILAIGDDLTQMTAEEGVTWIDGRGFKIYGQKLHEVESVPAEVAPHIYTYDGVIFMPYESAIDRIRHEAIDEYTLHLIEEGHI